MSNTPQTPDNNDMNPYRPYSPTPGQIYNPKASDPSKFDSHLPAPGSVIGPTDELAQIFKGFDILSAQTSEQVEYVMRIIQALSPESIAHSPEIDNNSISNQGDGVLAEFRKRQVSLSGSNQLTSYCLQALIFRLGL